MKLSVKTSLIRHLNQQYKKGNILRVTGDELADVGGVSRSTVYRDSEVISLWRELERLAKGGNPNARTCEDRIQKLNQRVRELEHDNERLLTNFVVVARRLNERGINPYDIFGDAVPKPGDTAWTSKIIPWDDT